MDDDALDDDDELGGDAIVAPVYETFEPSAEQEGIPEIVGLNYDGGVLKVTVTFHPTGGIAQAVFGSVRGFRLLDESDLLEFWAREERPGGWIWRVTEGGWFDLESLRGGFITGMTEGYLEFLLIGQSDCVSVIAGAAPEIVPRRN